MASYIGMYTRSQKGIKMRMETTISLYGNGNEITSWCLLCVGLCVVLSSKLLLHALLSSKHTAPNLYKSNQQ